MPGKTNTASRQPQTLCEFKPQYGQRDRNAAARAQNDIQVAVVGVMEIIGVTGKAQIAKEKLIEQAQFLQGSGIPRQTALEPRRQLIDIGQRLRHIDFRVLVLRQRNGRFQQRKAGIALHKSSKVLQSSR